MGFMLREGRTLHVFANFNDPIRKTIISREATTGTEVKTWWVWTMEHCWRYHRTLCC